MRAKRRVVFITTSHCWHGWAGAAGTAITASFKCRIEKTGRQAGDRRSRGKLMCGIAGIIELSGQRPVPEDAVRRMARAIVHRGPDEEGFYMHNGIGLGSRR